MADIALIDLGKKYGREWIFRHLAHSIPSGSRLAVLGGNGSGKSTLIQIISGFITPNEGKIEFSGKNGIVDRDAIRKLVSFASPYLQLIEEFTLKEMIGHSAKMKPFMQGMNVEKVIQLSGLKDAEDKFIRQFSSGMKQRLRLALAILADTDVLLLDEPVSNLDRAAITWYHQMIENHSSGRTVIVCSNAIAEEHFFCDKEINLSELPAKGRPAPSGMII